jgi:L-amino acid N-acyltransferase YncA
VRELLDPIPNPHPPSGQKTVAVADAGASDDSVPVLSQLVLRAMRAEDWPAVAAIYAEGIATRRATFETDVPSWDAWNQAHLIEHRVVAELAGEVVGWAALSPVSERCCYAGVVENSIYVASGVRGRGVGRALLQRLVQDADHAGIWTIQTGIFPENLPSIRLHMSCGFRVVGVRERIGRLDGVWKDVVFLERRSEKW